jgi:two-component system, NtrC family, sensor kinase
MPDSAVTNSQEIIGELQHKLAELISQQGATADILRVIANSPTDVNSVLNTIVESACELCDAVDALVLLKDGDNLSNRAHYGPIPYSLVEKSPINRNWVAGCSVIDKVPIHVLDVLSAEGDEFPDTRERARRSGTRTYLSVPLLREGRSIGTILLRRTEVHPFNDKQIALLQTFADQAVIAIENARLFNETKEALERQTATADILKVIASSPSDVQPVFEAIATSANRLLGGFSSTVFLFIEGMAHLKALTPTTPAADEILKSSFPRPVADFAPFRMTQAGEVIQILDTEATAYELKEIARARGYRSMLYAPLMNKGASIGFIAVTRVQAGNFADNHIRLLQTFADQAVIAIENARLFNETEEALERQTATADILKVIASSPGDVQPVFEAIATSSKQLLGGFSATVFRFVDGVVNLAAYTPISPTADKVLKVAFPRPTANLPFFELAKRGEVVQEADSETNPDAGLRELARARGFRSSLFSPLMSKGKPSGLIVVTRKEPGTFAEHHVQLLQTFADQAVIAIENVRLFDEVQARTRDLAESLEQQTATADVLKVISTSSGELEPVFEAMLENAVRLCDAKFAMLMLYEKENNEFRGVGKWNLPPAYSEVLGKQPIRADPKIPLGRAVITKQPVQVADILEDQSYVERFPGIVAVAELGGARTLLQVPMLKHDEFVGTIAIYRQEVRPFTVKQVALVQNFAAQAVIAIENARLLNELRKRTDDLTTSLNDLRTAQDRLVQTEKLASLGQLTAGIAHEIKNPLNFVNNFSSLSAELVDELDETLAPAALDQKIRGDVGELTAMLKSNLEKVIRHGKRADSIVKNMLLHSREGSGEHRSADINALVEESLNLAYHGARVEKSGFQITLKRDFDPDAGAVELYPQEITRALLNLISNGFYAATKRKSESADGSFEPTLGAATKSLGNKVEIRIRDNGTGIPSGVMEKMFNPFFTTKPAGEGTGLGLSMSHDIIVKQHGGRIDVETEPGVFTEFIVVLLRNGQTASDRKPQ